jgi:hypothetical protein
MAVVGMNPVKNKTIRKNACPDACGTFGDLPLSLASSMNLVPVREFHYFLALARRRY